MSVLACLNCFRSLLTRRRSAWGAAVAAIVMGATVAAAEDEAASAPTPIQFTAPEIPDEVTGTLRSFNESISKGVLPQENAVVVLLQILGDSLFDAPLRDQTFRMLGVLPDQAFTSQLIYPDEYCRQDPAISEGEARQHVARLHRQLREASDAPWTPADHPELTEYLEANREALDGLVAASRSSRYYAPMLAEDHPPRLMGASFAVERRLPFLASCLAARTLQEFANGDSSAAFSNSLACRKLALLLALGSPLDISQAKANVIDNFAFHVERVMLKSGKMSGAQAAEYLKLLQEIPCLPPSSYAADLGERAIQHQELEFLRTDRSTQTGLFEVAQADTEEDVAGEVSWEKIRWDVALESSDAIQNEIVAALSLDNLEEMIRVFQSLDARYAEWFDRLTEEEAAFPETLKTDVMAASRWIGENNAMSLRPNYWQRRLTDERARMRRDFSVVALAIQIHRDRHGEYPESLEQLAPEILESVPDDPHTGVPFQYTPRDNGTAYLLCLGMNRRDDAGKEFNDDLWIEFP